LGGVPFPTSFADPLAVPVAFLAAATIGALFALNARHPFTRDGHLSISVFFAGWLTSELPLHHLFWQVLATAAFVRAGALGAWPGWLGLAIAVGSWIGLLEMFAQARRAGDVVEEALAGALGPTYAGDIDAELRAQLAVPMAMAQLALPFAVRRAGVERIRGLSYGPAGRRNELDIYRPEDARPGCPVIVQVHGGAWILGNKEDQGQPLMRYLASLGWVCVAINYRLSPRATFPDHIADVKRAIGWVKANIARYGGDPDFVAITGGSAGGHLSSLAALTANDPAFQPGFEDVDTRVRACVPFYGVYDFTNRSGLGRADLRAFLGRFVFKTTFEASPEVFDRASPMSRVNAEAPPFLVIHGTNDTLAPVGEARLFVELLRKASRAVVAYAELPGAQHAFEVFASARTGHVVRGVARFLAFEHAAYLAARARPALAPAAATTRGAAAETPAPASDVVAAE
jgi:acetyl esterase/lipase